MNAPLIEFREVWSEGTGRMKAALVCAELPAGMFYRIVVESTGHCSCTSQANGPGSRRYYWKPTYEAAQEHGCEWALRKISEARRAP
jgi:hypothetical protein